MARDRRSSGYDPSRAARTGARSARVDRTKTVNG
jgi:hypothetical protein